MKRGLGLFLWTLAAPAMAQTLVQSGSPIRYLGNLVDPGVGSSWTAESFNDAAWSLGGYGVGYEIAPTGCLNLLQSTVLPATSSVYTRARFHVTDVLQINQLMLGADYDDGYVAWINGVEVYRSPEMPAGTPAWNTQAASHESSNGSTPSYGTLVDVTAAAMGALHNGTNVLAVGVWNTDVGSSELVVVPKLVANPVSTIVTRGPYLQRGTPGSIVVRWSTSTPTDSRVRYGSAPGSLGQVVDVPGTRTLHAVTLTGLASGATYYYSIGTTTATLEGDGFTHFFELSPSAGSTQRFRAWVIGDAGTATFLQRSVRNAYYDFTGAAHTDLWLMLGDNAYNSGTDTEYQRAVFDVYHSLLWKSVVWPTFGNHDAISANSSTETGPYYDIFTLPRAGEAGGDPSGTEAYYSFDHGNVHFVCLDSQESSRTTTGPMLTWLAQDLANTTQDWVIAFWHHPPYSKGSHDSDTEGQLIDMRQNALPILENAGVDLVLTGHSHSYERSFLIDQHYGSSGTFGPANVVDGGNGRPGGDGAYTKPTYGLAPHEGAVYAVAGSSGQISGGPLDHPAMYISLNSLGSMILDVAGNRLDATFLDSTGAVADSFTIVKGSAAVQKIVTGLGPDPAAAARVQAWSESGQPYAPIDFSAYGTGGFGANVGLGDINGTGTGEILTGPGPAPTFGPQVRAFATPSATPLGKVNFYAYGTLRYGVRAEDGDVDADGAAEILTGPGPGAVFGPHVRGFNFDGGTLAAMAKISFFAFNTLKFGVRPAGGTLDPDGFAEIVTGAGPGAVFGAAVRGFNYDNVAVGAIGKVNFIAYQALTFGAEVSVADLDADGMGEILTGPGAAQANPSQVRGFNFDGAVLTAMTGLDFQAYTNPYGVLVSGGDVDADGREEILTMPADPALPANGRGFDYSGTAVTAIGSIDFVADPARGYGGNVESGDMGF